MLSFEQARARIVASAIPLASESVPTSLAAGRVLAEPIRTHTPLPAWDYSAMDGYAVRAADFSGPGPYRLPVTGESRTGHAAPELPARSVCRIFTGARLPPGADSVLIQEEVERQGNAILTERRPTVGDHVRRAGEDLAEGAVALGPGTRITAFHLGLLLALDRASVSVARRPRVALISTGDELRPAGSEPRPGSIPESNGAMIAALAQGAGAETTIEPLLADDLEAMERGFREAAARSDVLITIGGASVGDHDLVKPALARAGAELDFWKVRIKPGKPLLFGRLGAAQVLGLPGNPVSAGVTFALFGLPLLRALQGEPVGGLRTGSHRLLTAIKQKPGRLGFYRGKLEHDGVRCLAGQASGSVTSLAYADAFILIPEDSNGAPEGSQVEVLRYCDL